MLRVPRIARSSWQGVEEWRSGGGREEGRGKGRGQKRGVEWDRDGRGRGGRGRGGRGREVKKGATVNSRVHKIDNMHRTATCRPILIH